MFFEACREGGGGGQVISRNAEDATGLLLSSVRCCCPDTTGLGEKSDARPLTLYQVDYALFTLRICSEGLVEEVGVFFLRTVLLAIALAALATAAVRQT